MKFCPECGTNIEGKKFCPECGFKVTTEEKQPTQNTTSSSINEHTIKEFSTFIFGLEDKKKSIMKNIDVSVPQKRYTLTNQRLIIEEKGVVKTNREEIELYKIKDVSVKQSLTDKVIGIGTVTVISKDPSTPNIEMKYIKTPQEIKELIRSAARNVKSNMNLVYKEEI